MVGDIIIIMQGMGIPADGVLIEGSEITTDESAMTGETGNRLIKFFFIINMY